jgi:membrane protease YdiL (CAAX protease family)
MPAPRLHPFWRLLVFIVGAVVVSTAIAMVIGIALSTAAILNGQNVEELDEAFTQRYGLWINLMVYPPLIAWLWFCRGALDRRSFWSMGLHGRSSGRLLWQGALCGAVAIAFLSGLLWLTRSISFNGPSPEAFEAGIANSLLMLGLYLFLFCAVGFVEELIFRGYVFQNLAAMLRPRTAMVIQAGMFALIHLGNAGIAASGTGAEAEVARQTAMQDAWRAMPGITLIGVFFALSYRKTGSLWFPIGFHIAWNFFLGCIFSLPVSGIPIFRLFDISPQGSTWLNGGTFGAEGSVLLLPIQIAMIWLLSRQPDHPQARLDLALLKPNLEQVASAIPTIKPALPVPTPYINEDKTEADDTPRQSRYKTSMRSADDEDEPVVLWGQLPRDAASGTPATPTEVIPAQEFAEQVRAPDEPVVAPQSEIFTPQSTLTPEPSLASPQPTAPEVQPAPQSTLPEESIVISPAPQPVEAPVIPAPPAGEQPEPGAPRKPPAPRW